MTKSGGMYASCRPSNVALVAFAAAMAALPVPAQQQGVAFPSPDGTRVVRLALTRLVGNQGAPSLQIEYSMVGTWNDVLIRPFASSYAGSEDTRYRVAWDQTGRRFAVIASELPASRKAPRVLQLPSGEYVLLGADRKTAAAARSSELKDWAIDTWKAAGAVKLPLKEFDLAKPTTEYVGKTGVVTHGANKYVRERVHNLTVHSNTQNFVPGRLARTPEIPVLTSKRAPAGGFEARLVRTDSPTLVLAEGDAFFDQQWVILHPLPEERLLPQNGIAPRLLWSQDGRHVLLVTPVSGQTGFARMPGALGEEVFLLFDVHWWQGTIAPSAEVVGKLQLAR
jgi:hypothetical protein